MAAARAAPLVPAVPAAASLRNSRALRNTFGARPWGVCAISVAMRYLRAHTIEASPKVSRKTLALCTKAHTTEDDGPRPDRRHLPFPR